MKQSALPSVAQLVVYHPVHQKVAGLTIGQGTCPGFRIDPQYAVGRRQLIKSGFSLSQKKSILKK